MREQEREEEIGGRRDGREKNLAVGALSQDGQNPILVLLGHRFAQILVVAIKHLRDAD